ncbi:hypothetical protein ACLB2K_034283 [Fragaria x ananassa]
MNYTENERRNHNQRERSESSPLGAEATAEQLAFQFGFSRLASPAPRLTLASLASLASPSPGRSLGDESPGCNDLPKIEAAWLRL